MEEKTTDVLKNEFLNIINEDTEALGDSALRLSKRFISLKETGVSSRTFLHWKENGLIDYNSDSRRVKLNAFEYIWVLCLAKMRNFGLSLDIIKKVRKTINIDLIEGIAELDNKGKEEALKGTKYLTKDKDKAKEGITMFESDEAKGFFKDTNLRLTMFNVSIIKCILEKEQVSINIYEDIDAIIIFEYTYELLKEMYGDEALLEIDKLETTPHLKLNLNYFINDFLKDDSRAEYLSNNKLLSLQELTVLRLLKNKEVEQITITKMLPHTEMRVATKTYKNLTSEKADKVRKELNMGKFDKIELTTNQKDTIRISRQTNNKI